MTRVRSSVLAVLVAALTLTACVERAATGPDWRPTDIVLGLAATSAPLVGTEWSLQSLAEASLDVAPDTTRSLRFTRGGVRELLLSASVGCNALGSSVDTVGTRIRVDVVVSTRIYCGEALIDLESRYAQALHEASYFGIRSDTLWLYDAALRTRARFTARP